MTRVKLCGFTAGEDVAAGIEAGADAIGVVVDVPVDTPRAVPSERAAELLAAVPPFVTGTIVTMPDSVADAVALVEAVEPDAIQVHAGLDPDEVGTLRERVPVPVVAGVDADEPDALAAYAPVADALLVDSVDAAGAGGTGEAHDWAATREATADLETPVVLAGGLTPDTVADAVATAEPYAVDVASGIERRGERGRAGGSVDGDERAEPRRDGRPRKDHDAMARFVREATGVAT